MMSTSKRKCPARVIMMKGNPPQFIIDDCNHIHKEYIRGNMRVKC